jgi:hypothetical protein
VRTEEGCLENLLSFAGLQMFNPGAGLQAVCWSRNPAAGLTELGLNKFSCVGALSSNGHQKIISLAGRGKFSAS